MKNVLYIGASGFVGSRLINVTRNEFRITNLDKRQSPLFPEITVIGDVRNQKDVENAVRKNITVVLLAAEHQDDVSPVSLYYDVNVEGTKNVLAAMEKNNVNNIIFTSSVAVYGLNKDNPDENSLTDPFNHYGKSKLQAEEVLREWFHSDPANRSLTIIRPTVIFGEDNRGNVYKLLKQISSGRFIMIGKGCNCKSMAYVGNVAAFIRYNIQRIRPGYQLFNYVDKPDLTMNELVIQIEKSLERSIPSFRIPYWLGLLGGVGFDLMSSVSGRKFEISSVRIRKFCARTQFQSAMENGFTPPYTLVESLHNTLKYEFSTCPKPEVTVTQRLDHIRTF